MKSKQDTACSHNNKENYSHYVVTSDQLPLSCPAKGMSAWDSHPRVFLPLEKTGRVRCPYCETEYVLPGCEDAPLTAVWD